MAVGRTSEVNRLTWQDVNFASRYVVIYARKKKGVNIGTCFNLA